MAHVDTSSFELKTYLASLKTEVDKLDIDKLMPVPVDLSKLSQNIIISGLDMSSSLHVDNKKKDILIFGSGPRKKFCLSLHYNGVNSYLFVNGTKIYKFKAKDCEIVENPLCSGNISKDWSVDNMKKTGFNGYVYDFSVDYDATDVDDMVDVHNYLMKKNSIV